MLNRVTEIVNEALHASGSSDVLSSQDASRFHSLLALHLVCLRREVSGAVLDLSCRSWVGLSAGVAGDR